MTFKRGDPIYYISARDSENIVAITNNKGVVEKIAGIADGARLIRRLKAGDDKYANFNLNDRIHSGVHIFI